MEKYQEWLERALQVLPKVESDRERLKVPEPEVVTAGNRTVLKNLKAIASALNRDPQHLMKFLLRELGAAGSSDGSQAFFQGRFTPSVIKGRIDRYMEEFVKCKSCNRPDTKLVKQGRIYMMRCEACGARSSVRNI
ncbi:MAG: translation initiation factor IF-2 subunit beta [Hadesarchaea archaeon]|nr:MAG: translation initiation factor IF-2 subunit beta [Hadesarchaea archaeon]TDA33869.1 MAG: translation initiation factor IF-2 subunit beta [Hadesarchaea archaeon]